MNKTNVKCFFSKLIFIIISTVFLYCPADRKAKERSDREGNFIELWLYIVYPVWQKTNDCSQEDSLDEGNKNECLHNKLVSGLIYDSNTGEKITASTIQGIKQLECRCSTDTGYGRIYATWWDKSPLEFPSRGTKVEEIPNSTSFYYSIIKPFNNYNIGDHLVCVANCESGGIINNSKKFYQLLSVK